MKEENSKATEIVLDTSVVISWFFNQTQTASSLKYLNSDFKYLAPDLLHIEFDQFLTKSIRIKDIPLVLGQKVHEEFNRIPIQLISTQEIKEQAFFISNSLYITIFDAYFLSSAIITSSILLTADQRLHNRIQQSKYKPYSILLS
ncbi:PIN domain-containing protein [bacterium]|nr:MAG: PIN domain-containing protein [bacterium]